MPNTQEIAISILVFVFLFCFVTILILSLVGCKMPKRVNLSGITHLNLQNIFFCPPFITFAIKDLVLVFSKLIKSMYKLEIFMSQRHKDFNKCVHNWK